MSNLAADKSNHDAVGGAGRLFHVPAGATVYEGGFAAILESNGKAVALTTAGAGPCVGMFMHGAAADERVNIETGRIYRVKNGTSGDACSDATPLYSRLYASDDNTACDNSNSGARQFLGLFMGMEPDGKVRVLVTPEVAAPSKLIQTGAGTLVAGVLTVNAGITLTAASRIFLTRKTAGGTSGDELRVPTADRTTGGPGTASMTIRSYLSAVAATSDTSTVEWLIVTPES